jgi:glycosyltransferase involved in cell wall biosynthesis
MKPYNVLHVLGTAQSEGTGIARIVAAIAAHLDPGRFRVHAWFLGGDGPLAKWLESAGVPVRPLDWQHGVRDPLGAWRFWRSLRHRDFAILHQHYGGRSVRWLARGATGASIVVHLHGRVVESQGPHPVSIRIPGADVVIATSRAVADQAIGVRPHVVYPGVEIPDNESRGTVIPHVTTARVIGTAGRLVPIKGIVYLIRALASLRTEIPDLRLEIAGSGPERSTIENEIRSHGLTDCVTFLDWQAELLPVFARWDIFVLPSLEESFGIAALEAMAAGLPVVATAVGGVPELVEDGRTGWLVPPANPNALADRLRGLLLDPEERRAMGAAGQARARESFSVGRMVTAISEIYDQLLKTRQ